MGAITPQGATLDEYWDGVRDGRVAIRKVEHLPMDGYRTEIGGEVQSDRTPEHEYLNPDGFHDRAIDFTMRAAEEAMEQLRRRRRARPAGALGRRDRHLQRRPARPARSGGSAREKGEKPDPRLVLLVPPQAIAEALSGAFDVKGPVLSVDTACAASANAIGYASALIRDGPGRRRAHRRRRRVLGHPHRRLQLARVAFPRARRAVLARPQGPLARRGQRHAGR